MKSYTVTKLIFVVIFALYLGGCEQESETSATSNVDAEFDKTVADRFFCSVYAQSVSENREARRHMEPATRMQAASFCKPNYVDYYTCFAMRDRFSTNEECPRPSPLPTEAEILQCADAVAAHLSKARGMIDERIRNIANLSKQNYMEVCPLGDENVSGLPSYN